MSTKYNRTKNLSDAFGSSTFSVHSITWANVTHKCYGKYVEYEAQSSCCFHCLRRFHKTLSRGEYHHLQIVLCTLINDYINDTNSERMKAHVTVMLMLDT